MMATSSARLLILCIILLTPVASAREQVRTFTDSKGRSMEAEMLSLRGNEATLRRKSDGRAFRFQVGDLSEADQTYIEEYRERMAKTDAPKEDRLPRSNQKIVTFVEASLGQVIGNGECWTLLDEAYKEAKIKRPGSDVYVWGKAIDLKKDEPLPGDVVQWIEPKDEGGFRRHTSMIFRKIRSDEFEIIEANFKGKEVKKRTIKMDKLSRSEKDEVFIYRPPR